MKSKNLKFFFLTLIWVALLGSCENDEIASPPSGNVQFALQNDNGGRLAETFEPAMLLISVQTPSGSAVITLDEFQLYKFQSEGYLSDALQLPAGQYKLTDFVVLNKDREAIAATPKEGSPLAGSVTDPLPISFEVKTGQSSMVKPQVVKFLEDTSPDDLGYTVFSFDVVEHPILPTKKIKALEWKVYDESLSTYVSRVKYRYNYNYSDSLLTSIDMEITDPFYSQTKKFLIEYNLNNRVSKVTEGPTVEEFTYLPDGRVSRIEQFDYSYNNERRLYADNVYDYTTPNKIIIRTHEFSEPYNSDPSSYTSVISMKNGNPELCEAFYSNPQYNGRKWELTYDTKRNPFKAMGIMGVMGQVGNGNDLFGSENLTDVINFNNVLSSKFTDNNDYESEQELPANSTYTYDSEGYPLTRTFVRGSVKKMAIFTYH